MPPRCAVLPFLTQQGGRSLLVVSYIPFPIQRGGVCLLVVPFLLNGIFLILLNQILTNSIVTHEITVSQQLRPPPTRVSSGAGEFHPPPTPPLHFEHEMEGFHGNGNPCTRISSDGGEFNPPQTLPRSKHDVATRVGVQEQ